MQVSISIILFSLMILLYWIISEFFTILFRFTGLPDEKARFQVISLLTGCGFTTRESEMILTTKHRRRLARTTMLFGYVFNITIVSALINVFLSLKLSEANHLLSVLLIPLIVVTLILISMRVPGVRAWGDRQLERLADRFVYKNSSNTVLILDYIGQETIALVSLKTVPDEFREKSLSNMGLRETQNILVMLIEHGGGKAEPAKADTVFVDGDKLTVYGNYKTICKSFHAREQFAE